MQEIFRRKKKIDFNWIFSQKLNKKRSVQKLYKISTFVDIK